MHPLAALTIKNRRYIRESGKSVRELKLEFPLVSLTTLRKWKNRDDFDDRSHQIKTRNTVMSAIEEDILITLRRELALSLDDLVEVMQRCVNPLISRSATHRALQRFSLSKPRKSQTIKTEIGSFPPCEIGFLHFDVKYLPRLAKQPRLYLFVAIDRVSRFVVAQVRSSPTKEDGAQFLEKVIAEFPYPIHTILTDNGGEFSDRFSESRKGKIKGKPSYEHPFDQICLRNNIEHRFTRPFTPKTNGMVERFNRRIKELLIDAKNLFKSNETMSDYTMQFIDNYNKTRLKCLNYKSPLITLHNHAELYTCGRVGCEAHGLGLATGKQRD